MLLPALFLYLKKDDIRNYDSSCVCKKDNRTSCKGMTAKKGSDVKEYISL